MGWFESRKWKKKLTEQVDLSSRKHGWDPDYIRSSMVWISLKASTIPLVSWTRQHDNNLQKKWINKTIKNIQAFPYLRLPHVQFTQVCGDSILIG